jgi:16S rRNA (uracil1498-N3)-methyltransferase
MVLPLFQHPLSPKPTVGDVVLLAGAEAKHAVSVRRMRVGEGIQLANGQGFRVVGAVANIDGQSLTVTVSQVTQEAEPDPALVLVQALAKGDRDELAIQAATELGSFAIVPWQAERSISRWDGPKIAKGVERWQTIVAEAAKQALRSFTPQVAQPVTSKELAKMVAEYSVVLVLDPTAENSLVGADLPKHGNVAIVVGPEGGISESELVQLQAAGAVRVHLGESILRTSTAGVAAISVLQAKLGHWG